MRLKGAARRLKKQVAQDRHPIQRQCYRFGPVLAKYFVDDLDHPYRIGDHTNFLWIRSRSLAGRTVLWARMTVRMSDLVFKAASRDGYGVDWPISYDDLASYYSKVESAWGIFGYPEGWDEVPDGEFVVPPAYTEQELAFKKTIEEQFPERRVSMMRKVPWYEHQEVSPHEIPGSTSAGSFIRDATRTGRLTIAYNFIVAHILLNEAGTQAIGVEVVDRETKQRRAIHGDAVFLGASTLESTRILMNERSDRWPNGLGNDCGVLGHYLADHLTGPGLMGSAKAPPVPVERGLIEMYTPNWLPYDTSRDFLRGYQIQTMLGIPTGEPHRTGWSMSCFGEILPRYENRMELDHTQLDAWGLPTLKFHFQRSENDVQMGKHALKSMIEIAEATGLDIEQVSEEVAPAGRSVHEVGTARMGHDANASVVDAFNRVHGCPNVLVVDGAC
ncbi:hypothetical protein C2W62_40390 [Candidatus Entotheonella serta]|nr:hypothetical protein C2W62_40390 [Candidatus Entotheonella serta]